MRTDIAVLDQPGLPATEAAADSPPVVDSAAEEAIAKSRPFKIRRPRLRLPASRSCPWQPRRPPTKMPEPPAPDAAWPRPRMLIDQLTRLTAAGRGVPWANEALDLVERLLQTSSTNLDARERIL